MVNFPRSISGQIVPDGEQSMAKNRMFIGLCAACALFASLPAEAVGLPKRFEFGRIALGAAVYEVPEWAVKGDCRSRSSLVSCSFFDSSGVEYGLVDGYVCEKTFHIERRNNDRLPYGIRFESSKPEVISYLSKKLKLKFSENESRIVVSDELAPDVFDGSAIILDFDRNNKVTSIELWSLCT